LLHSRTKSVIQNIRGSVERVLRATQKLLGSRRQLSKHLTAVDNNWSKTWHNGQKSMFLVLFQIKHNDKIGEVVGRLVEVLREM